MGGLFFAVPTSCIDCSFHTPGPWPPAAILPVLPRLNRNATCSIKASSTAPYTAPCNPLEATPLLRKPLAPCISLQLLRTAGMPNSALLLCAKCSSEQRRAHPCFLLSKLHSLPYYDPFTNVCWTEGKETMRIDPESLRRNREQQHHFHCSHRPPPPHRRGFTVSWGVVWFKRASRFCPGKPRL